MNALHGVLVLLLICTVVQVAAGAEEYEYVTQWGDFGQYGLATDIAASNDGSIYVVDQTTVKKFSNTGTLIATWDRYTSTPAHVYLGGIAVDGDGNVFVGEQRGENVATHTFPPCEVTKFSPSGVVLATPVTFDTSGYLVHGIALGPGGKIYVGSDYGGSLHFSRVEAYSSTGGILWRQQMDFVNETENPYMGDIAADASGNVYMVDSYISRLVKYAPNGNEITRWGSRGSGTGSFDSPEGIAVDAMGDVYVADTDNHRIQKFRPDGTFVTAWGTFGSGDGQMVFPMDVTVDSAGDVYVFDAWNARIQKFTREYNAQFTSNPVTGFNPLSVQFTDTSTDTPTSWSWNFGDGQTSTTQSPSHAYANPGTYSVTLTVTYEGGVTRSVTKGNLITVLQSLHANFDVGSRIGYAPYTAVFTDATTGTPTSWHWDFGDGQSSTAQNPWHTYQNSGNYTVQLTVSNPVAGTKTATKSNYIRVLPLWNGLIRTEAEDYDYDYHTEGTGYHDTTVGNSGGAYRSDDVDIVVISYTTNQGYAVSNIAEGEWTRYWVQSPASVEYDYPLSLRVAGWVAGQTITATVVGMPGSIDIPVPDTGSATSYTIVNTTLRLAPGMNIVRFTYHGSDGTAMNFDYFTLDPSGLPPSPTPTPTPWPVLTIPGGTGLPTWVTVAGKFDDVNGNNRKDFADVVLYFNQMAWIAVNEPVEGFDYNGNSRIDFADVVWLFNNL